MYNVKKGDYVKKGDSLATIHANDLSKLETAKKRFLAAYSFTEEPYIPEALIRGIVE